ncbi:hypothetical protein [Haloterrigena salifodinae]|uniref:CARDB domain-containing protein n=1 Tax=Haloterrigena salifodinae TaxID=2675099 RepID=A0A8T8E4V8_9EURY|nr:hypothetical protein [Haloterrigena salifodinae]QRV16637.1 hypothetical protein JMJ58_07120 [Haloterrigena salifodinae]
MDRRKLLKGAGALGAALTGLGGASTAAGRHRYPSVRIINTNEPLRGGEWFRLTARITNHGSARLRGNARLIVGNDPDQVDSRYVSLASNQSTTVTLGYRTYPVQTRDVFPVRVRCENESDSRIISVAPAP